MKSYWNLAITISLLFHALILINPHKFFKNTPRNKVVTIEKNIKELQMEPERIEKIVKKAVDEPSEPIPLPYTENILNTLMKNNNLASLEKPQTFEKNTKEILFSEITKIDKDLEKNPAYMNYYRLVRERVRTNAQRNYDSTVIGEALVSFLISNDGSLKEVNFDSDSPAGASLKSIILKSIRESSPFPVFPPSLNKYSQCRFNIPISFEKK